ncbi:MAG: glycosyltransferase family 2 protein [Anaerolineales bacterium]
MSSPLVSVVIPSYNQAEFLPATIHSVLNQTYQNFEIIVVNDASPDNTDEVMKQFADPRIKYIVHETNRRLPASRNTGMRASKGEIIALLDADDLFHPEKLEAHVKFLNERPDVGVSYNARYDLNHSAETIRGLWRPPLTVSLVDLVLGFPFSPSDTVVRRDWAFKVGLFNPDMGSAEDTDFPCRLALAGCKFAGIDRALNYRRYHAGRGRKNLEGRLNDVERALAAILADPRCSEEARALGDKAIKHHMMVIVSLALMQKETEIAQKYLYKLVALDPGVIQGNPCELVAFLLSELITDDSVDHEAMLETMFAQLPQEFQFLSSQLDWATQRGFLWKGIRAVIWDRLDDGRVYFKRAAELKAVVDEPLLQLTTYHLLGYEHERGSDAALNALANLRLFLNQLVQRGGDKLESSYLVNRAFENYRKGEYNRVPGKVLQAWTRDFSYVFNRGVLSIFVRSMLRAAR